MRLLRRKERTRSFAEPTDSTVLTFSGGKLFLRMPDGSRWQAKEGVELEIRHLGGGDLIEDAFDLLEEGPAELRR